MNKCAYQVLSITSDKLRCSKTGEIVKADCDCPDRRDVKPVDIKLDLEDGELGLF